MIEKERGNLSMPEILCCKCRYLTARYVIGCREFAREVSGPLELNRKRPITPAEVNDEYDWATGEVI